MTLPSTVSGDAWPEVVRLTSRQDAEGIRFTLEAVGIACRVEAGLSDGREPARSWSVRVPESAVARAREVVAEEGISDRHASRTGDGAAGGLPFVVGLAAINLVAWLGLEAGGGSEVRSVLLRFGASLASAIDAGQWWRTLTAVFLHMGPKHLLANMFMLVVLGPPSVRAWGPGRALFLYLAAGAAGNWMSYALSPTVAVKAGASGAILGLLGVLAGTRIRQLWETALPSRFRAWHIVAMVVAFYGFAVGAGPSDHLAHLGGLACGCTLALALPTPGRLPPTADRALGLGLGLGSAAVTAAAAVLQLALGG